MCRGVPYLKRGYHASALILLVFWMQPAAAQLPDSLARSLPASRSPRVRIDTLNQRAWVLRHNRPEEALLLAREARRLADSLAYEDGQAWAWRNEGVIEYIRGNYEAAISADIKGLRIFHRLGNEEGIASAYNNIGVVHWELGHFDKAEKYFADALTLDASMRQRATATANLGLIQTELGRYDEALRLSRAALNMYMEDGDLLAASTALNNIGWVYELKKDYDQALREYERCLALRERLGDRRRIASVSLSLGTVLRHKQRYEESLARTQRAIGIATEIGEKKILEEGAEELSRTYAAMGRYEDAYREHVRASALRAELLDENKARELAEVEASYQLEQAEKEVELLRRTNALNATIAYVTGGVLLLLVIFTIITVRNSRIRARINQQLQATQQQLILQGKLASLGQLTAGIAHEIRNPLNFIKNFSELSTELVDELCACVDDPSEFDEISARLRQNIEKIHQHGNRADAIVRGMMLHAHRSSEQRQWTDVNALLGNVIDLASHGSKSDPSHARVEFEARLEPDLPRINVVPQDLSQVFLNMLNNAIDAVQEHRQKAAVDYLPRVLVTTALENRSLVIRIRDNGTGIPEEIRNRIFEPFYTTKEAGRGTGLGLSISYDLIVQKYGGRMTVDSEKQAFTEFTITLPAG